MSNGSFTNKGKVICERVIYDAIFIIKAERIITGRQLQIIFIMIDVIYSWKVDENNNLSRKSTAKRRTKYDMSYKDIYSKLHVSGNLSRYIPKLKELGIIYVDISDSNRQKATYYFESDYMKWNIPDEIKALLPDNSNLGTSHDNKTTSRWESSYYVNRESRSQYTEDSDYSQNDRGYDQD